MRITPRLKEAPVTAFYVDDARDARDAVLRDAVRAAIKLIGDGSPDLADGVLRLARDRLMSSWPHTNEMFTAEVANV